MASNVRVAVRVRPLLAHEVEGGHKQSIMQVNKAESAIE